MELGLQYIRYSTDSREEHQTSGFKGNYTLYTYDAVCYIILPLWSWCAHQILWTVNVSVGCVICQRCWHTLPQEDISHHPVYPQGSVSGIIKSHNYKAVSFNGSKIDWNTSSLMFSSNGKWKLRPMTNMKNKYDDRRTSHPTIIFFHQSLYIGELSDLR